MDREKDERFSNIWKDPRFKPISKKARKVQIDKRFQSMFTDDSFKMKFVDKRGRSIQESSTENLKKFYELTSSSEDEKNEFETDEETDKELTKSKQMQISSFNEAESGSTTSEESDLEADDDEFDHKWGELQIDAPEIENPTNRIAICNMNWDRIKAEDIFVLLNSFKPPNSAIHSVKIYPSEYGMQRMKEEEVNGPKELVEKVLQSDEEDEATTEDGAAYHREKLRQYQISRLKYYFAIVECDTPTTASIIYKELNGMEYESSAITLDLRFVPEDMTFEQEPSSVATSLPDMSNYKPSLFSTTALQQIQVRLTWDETNPQRLEAMQSAFEKGKEADIQNVDLSAFLASSSSSEDEAIEENISKIDQIKETSSKKKRVEKYKELLQNLENEGEKENKDMELEISWNPSLQKSAKELIKTKQKTEEMTPMEQYLQKRKEKKKQKQKEKSSISNQDFDSSEENEIDEDKGLSETEDTCNKDIEMLKLLTADGDVMRDEESTKAKAKNKKKLKKKQKLGNTKELENFQVNVTDPRFSALYTSHLYNIEPADPHFKETEGMKAILEQKQKQRRRDVGIKETKIPAKSKLSGDTEKLVTSIKQKTLANKRKRK